MNPDLLLHLNRLWPLAAIAAGLFVYLVIVLIGGVFYTNQGRILRDREPNEYWGWVRRFLLLFLVATLVLLGSYFLPKG